MRTTLTLKKTQPPADHPKREFYEQVRMQLVALYGLTDEQVSRLSTGCVSTILDTVQYAAQCITQHEVRDLPAILNRAISSLQTDHRYHAVLRQNSLPSLPPMPLWRVRKILEGVGPVLHEVGSLLQSQQYRAESLSWLAKVKGEFPDLSQPEIEWLVRVHRTAQAPEICQRLGTYRQITSIMSLILTDRQLAEMQRPPIDQSQPYGPQIARIESLLKASL